MGFNIPMNIKPAYNSNTILSQNQSNIKNVPYYTTTSILNIGAEQQQARAEQQPIRVERQRQTETRQQSQAERPRQIERKQPEHLNTQQTTKQTTTPKQLGLPPIQKQVQKGQRIDVTNNNKTNRIKLILGWDIKDTRCDVDTSAFLLGADGKCPSDEWFIFYGQPKSPNNSVIYSKNPNGDSSYKKAIIGVDLNKLDERIQKIPIVITINEALTQNLNFSMLNNTYLKIIDANTNKEIFTFILSEYYKEVASMVIGELYRYKDTWKFNCIGNGVAKDLAGLCEMYGIETN